MEATTGEAIVDIGNYDIFVSTIAGARASALIMPKAPRNIERVLSRLKTRFAEIGEEKKQQFIDRIVTTFSFDLTPEQTRLEEEAWSDLLKLGEIGDIIREVDNLLGSKLDQPQQVDFIIEGTKQMIVDIDQIQRHFEDTLWGSFVTRTETLVLGIQTMSLCKLCLAQALKRLERKRKLDPTVQKSLLWVVLSLARFDYHRREKGTSFMVDLDMFWLYQSMSVDDMSELNMIVRESLRNA